MKATYFIKNYVFYFRMLLSRYLVKPFSKFLYPIKYSHIAPDKKYIHININDITGWYGGNRYDEFTFSGQIKGGDWSKKITARDEILKKSTKYKSVIQRYKQNLPWSETDIFKKRYQKQLQEGIVIQGIDNINELEEIYYKRYDTLFKNIKNHGILIPSEDNPDILPIYILINKNGELLFTVDGNHRLNICLVLGIKKIPVRVWKRHSEWQRKRDYILSMRGKNLNKEYQEYLDHPDIISELYPSP